MQFYAPTSGHGDSEVDRFTTPGNHRQNAKEGHSGCTGGGGGGGEEGTLKLGRVRTQTWETFVDPTALSILMRGLGLLEFATLNNLVLLNTLGPHKPFRRWTWHSPDGKHHSQFDYILVR